MLEAVESFLLSLAGLGYVGIFLISFIGASSVILPIPYTLVLLVVAPLFNPWLLALACGLGSALAEFVGYGIGYGGRRVVGKKYKRRLDAVRKLIERFGSVAIFVFALTPLPDDLLFIPLGLVRYSIKKALPVAFVGKFLMALTLVYVGKVLWKIFVLDWWFALITTVLLAVFIALMFKINWEKIVDRYVRLF